MPQYGMSREQLVEPSTGSTTTVNMPFNTAWPDGAVPPERAPTWLLRDLR